MHGTFTILGIDFPAYFTLLMVGFMAGIYWGFKEAVRAGVDPNKILDLGILLVIAGIAGGRIAHVLFDGELTNYWYLCTDPLRTTGELLQTTTGKIIPCTSDAQCVQADMGQLCNVAQGTCHWGQDCLRVFKFWYGGLTYYGGFLLVIPTGIWFLRRNKINPWVIGDLGAFCLPFGIAFGRMGCFFAGCCFGQPTDEPWGVRFPVGSPAWRKHHDQGLISLHDPSLAVHPTQLYTVVAMLGLALFMYWFYRRRRTFIGEAFWLMGLLYAIIRFVIEMFRADERGEYFGFSTSQDIGILLALASIYMLRRTYRRAKAKGQLLAPGAPNPTARLGDWPKPDAPAPPAV